MTHGKTYNKSPHRINHKATKSKTNTIYSRKVVLGMIDQCHSETDIVNYILPYIIVINFKIFYN